MTAGRSLGRAGEPAQPAVGAEPDVEQHDVDLGRGDERVRLRRASPRRPRRRDPAVPRAAPRSLRGAPDGRRRSRSGSAARPPRSTRPPLQRDVGPAARPAADVENRPDRLGPLLHVHQPEVSAALGRRAGVAARCPDPRRRRRGRPRNPWSGSGRRSAAGRASPRSRAPPGRPGRTPARPRPAAACRRPARGGPRRRRAARSGGRASRAPDPTPRSSRIGRRRSPQIARSRSATVRPSSAPSVSPAVSSRRTSSVSSWSASSWMSAASRARSASVAATTRSRWSCARLATRASGRTVNRAATATAASQMKSVT